MDVDERSRRRKENPEPDSVFAPATRAKRSTNSHSNDEIATRRKQSVSPETAAKRSETSLCFRALLANAVERPETAHVKPHCTRALARRALLFPLSIELVMVAFPLFRFGAFW